MLVTLRNQGLCDDAGSKSRRKSGDFDCIKATLIGHPAPYPRVISAMTLTLPGSKTKCNAFLSQVALHFVLEPGAQTPKHCGFSFLIPYAIPMARPTSSWERMRLRHRRGIMPDRLTSISAKPPAGRPALITSVDYRRHFDHIQPVSQ